MSASPQLSRVHRAWRGCAAAFFSTVCAAASHALAGGQITLFAFAVTVLLSLPVCVALAGKLGSLWRIAVAISLSQFLFHWFFSGIGAHQQQLTAPAAHESTHSHNLHGHTLFVPELIATPQGMWFSHLVAAVATTLLLSYGERAALALRRTISRTVFPRIRQTVSGFPGAQPLLGSTAQFEPITRYISIASISHRGPPCASSFLTTYAA